MPHNPHTSLGQPFVIRRLDTAGYRLNPQIPSTVAQSDCFLYLRAGEVLTDVGAEPFLVGEGQFLYIPSGLAFSIKYYNGSLGYMGAFSSCILEAPHLGLLGRTGPVLIDIPEDERGLVVSLAEKLVREQSAGRPSGRLLSCTLDLLLSQMDSLVEAGPGHPRNTVCTRFLDMVFDRSADIMRVSEYAGELGVSPNHLNRVVKGETGRSAGEWIGISRLALSKLLLRQSDMPVIDIASRAGFDDQSYFSRFFRKMTGMSPSEFRTGENRGPEVHV